MARVVYNYKDFSGETSSVGFNIDALANESALRTDLEAVNIGQLQQVTLIDSVDSVSSANASSQWAQVELGLRVAILDTTNNETGYFTVPCPDLANLTINGDVVDLDDLGIMAAFVTEVELHVLSRDGNPVSVTGATIVGRNR